ncbi:TetR/AcrR family transcriptional regulator [Nocardia jejuensis]|uniref:TetR/AcrR family transcriptional regulator n=1 Tax=Nocardia jejuensis TaxID=328049 RepID=UPI000ACB606F|nr:TetR/AcrR family transcriptional regulator [Nocardia jejuensis]
MPPSALRDRKRERTRRALLEAAVEQFESRGYEATTVADIAAAAEVGTRTFFNYFASKEELLFPEPDERVTAAVQAIVTRRPDERPVEVLLRALRAAGDNPGDHLGDTLAARIGVLRAQTSRTVPAVSGRAAYAQLASQQEIARQLRVAFPDELDDVGAAALVGAVIGAVTGALTALFQNRQAVEDPDRLHRQIRETTSKVLAPWLTPPCSHSHDVPEPETAPAHADSGTSDSATSDSALPESVTPDSAKVAVSDTGVAPEELSENRTSPTAGTSAPERYSFSAEPGNTFVSARIARSDRPEPVPAGQTRASEAHYSGAGTESVPVAGPQAAEVPPAATPIRPDPPVQTTAPVTQLRSTVLEQPSWRARVHAGSPVMLTDRRMGIAPELRRSTEPPAATLTPDGESDAESDSRGTEDTGKRPGTNIFA